MCKVGMDWLNNLDIGANKFFKHLTTRERVFNRSTTTGEDKISILFLTPPSPKWSFHGIINNQIPNIMSDKIMIITEAIMVILSLVAVLSGATHHLFFLVGLSLLMVVHIKQYQSLKDENNANI